MEKDIVFKLSELFGNKEYFDLIMLSVFTARNDLYKINTLLEERKEDVSMSTFIFKLCLGITKNAFMLADDLFKNTSYKDKLKSMQNWELINNKYNDLVICNGGNDRTSFSYMVLNGIRNQTFHYSFNACDLNKISEVVELLSDEDLLFKISSTDIDYSFADEIYYNFALNSWKKYNGNDDKVDDLSSFIKKIREMAIIIANLFDLISYGYFISFTSYKDACNDISIILKKI